MPRIFRLTLFLVVSSPLLFSQVIIREKVELAPKPSAVAVAGQLEVTLSLSGSLNPNRPAFVRASNFGCGIDVIGGTSVSAPLKAGVYQIVGRFSTAGAVSYALRVKVGSDELLVEQGVAPANATINLVPQVGFSSGIKFSFGGPIVQGQTAGYGFIGFVSTPCSTPAVHSLLSTTLSITTGQGLGEFVDETGRLLGESVTRKLNELGGIWFIANGRSPVGSQEEVGIQATMGGGVAGTASLVVIKKQADCSDAPPCLGITEYDLNPFKWDNHPQCGDSPNTLGRTRDRPPRMSIKPCFDPGSKKWKLEVTRVSMAIYYGVCTNNIKPEQWISSLAQITRKDIACAVISDFNKQIDQLRNSVESGFAQQPIPGLKGYNSYEAILLHENQHAFNLANIAREAAEKIQAELRSKTLDPQETCDPQEVAKKLGVQKAIEDFRIEYFEKRKKKFNDYEIDSRRIHLVMLEAQVEAIERDWGKCSQ